MGEQNPRGLRSSGAGQEGERADLKVSHRLLTQGRTKGGLGSEVGAAPRQGQFSNLGDWTETSKALDLTPGLTTHPWNRARPLRSLPTLGKGPDLQAHRSYWNGAQPPGSYPMPVVGPDPRAHSPRPTPGLIAHTKNRA